MNILTSEKSFLLAPAFALLGYAVIVVLSLTVQPEALLALFDKDGASPVELMTLPLFALIVPLVWLCPPCGGRTRRQCLWAALWSLLAILAIVRQTDLHKILFAHIYPAIDASFKGTVYKMRFLKAGDIPVAPKIFVCGFFAVFFAAVAVPVVRYIRPLVVGFFRREVTAWTMATFGAVSTAVLVIDRLPAKLRKAGVLLSDSTLALMKALEEGGEMLMALLALLAILQAHLIFGRRRP
jgi:hypothetical protein